MRTAILGVGLIGGSIGMALRQAGWPVAGWGPRRESLELAIQLGAIDRAATTPGTAIADAELVIVAAPIRDIPVLFRSVAASAARGTVVTDVASIKEQVMQWASELLPPYLEFVGGHPMAGKELQSVRAAEAELLRGCTYCLTPTSEKSLEAGRLLAETIKAVPLVVHPAEHDAAVAAASHLPFVVATALVRAVGGDLEGLAGDVASTGFRDTTRVAAGSPAMHADISRFNQAAIRACIERFEQQLSMLKDSLADASVESLFTEARDARIAWSDRHPAKGA